MTTQIGGGKSICRDNVVRASSRRRNRPFSSGFTLEAAGVREGTRGCGTKGTENEEELTFAAQRASRAPLRALFVSATIFNRLSSSSSSAAAAREIALRSFGAESVLDVARYASLEGYIRCVFFRDCTMRRNEVDDADDFHCKARCMNFMEMNINSFRLIQ